MKVCLIEVPYMAGDEGHAGSKGPERYVQAGAERLLATQGFVVAVQRVERREAYRDTPTASLAVGKPLGLAVRQAMTAGQLPLVLAGSCDVAWGVLSGFEHARCGVVWVDAHGDFNTPETTLSGFFPGMALAVVVGDCYRDLWAQMDHSEPIPASATLMLGVRELDPAERERLERSAIRVVGWREGRPQSDVLASLDELATRVEEVYLHVDMDGMDPQIAPGIVDPPVPGGLSLQDIEELTRAVAARFRVRAATLANHDPERDRDDTTLRTGLRIIELLAGCAGAGQWAV